MEVEKKDLIPESEQRVHISTQKAPLDDKWLFPIEPLWMPQGRVIVEPIEFNVTTKSGIKIPYPQRIMVMTGRVTDVAGPIEVTGKIKRGDYVLFYYNSGMVCSLAYHNPSEHLLCVMHAQDIIAKWTVDPFEYLMATDGADLGGDYLKSYQNLLKITNEELESIRKESAGLRSGNITQGKTRI